MKLIKGLQTDTNEQDQPSDSYIWALNWVANQKVGSLVSERGFQEVTNMLPPDMFPIGMMPTADKVIIFSTDGVAGVANKSEIGIYDETTGIYTARLNNTIATTLGGTITGLDFSLLHQIKAIYRFNAKGDLEVAFTDWFNPPRIITLTNIVADMADYYLPYDINKLNIFQTALFNKVDSIIQSSGSLISDTYFAFYRYKNIDQTVTAAYVHPEPLYIIIDNSYDDYRNITGNDIGGTTNKSIKIDFGVLDSTFPLVEVGLYRVSTAEAKVISTIPTTQDSATLSAFEGTVIQPSEVISPRIYYSRAKTLSSLNDIVYLGNLEKDTFDVPQKYINSLRLQWHCKMVDPAKNKQNKDYNNPLKTFMANEVYSFVIRFKFKDGSYSDWKHIPGRKAVTNRVVRRRDLTESPNIGLPAGDYIASKNLVNYVVDERAPITSISPEYSNYQGQVFHTIDTCAQTLSVTSAPTFGTPDDYFEGLFGYWENDNENYVEYFTGEDTQIWNASGNTGAIINDPGINEKVRHHKFPSLNFIEKSLPTVTYPGPNATFDGPHAEKTVAHFANSFPQFGVKLDQSNINLSIPADILANIVDYELGFSARDFNNATVYGQDLSLFGVYAGAAFMSQMSIFGFHQTVATYLGAQAVRDAIYFTGSNNVGGGIGFKSTCADFDGAGNLIGHNPIFEGTQETLLQNWTHAPIPLGVNIAIDPAQNHLPNRQRIHTPDLVDPLFPVNNPAIAPTHIRHEVMIVTGQKELVSPFVVGAGKNLYHSENIPSAFLDNFIGINTYSLIDYCGEFNRGTDENKNTAANYSTHCLKNIPDAWVHRNIKAGGYVPKDTKGVIIGDNQVINAGFNYTDGGGELYGGSDHFHIQLYDKEFPRPVTPEKYADTTNKVLALYSSFLTHQNYSGAGLPDSLDSRVANFYRRHPIPSLNFCRTFGSHADVERQHHSAFLCSIQRFSTSIYNKFYNIPVINTLQNPVETAGIFMGDCFISEVQYVTHAVGCPITKDPVNNPYVGQNFTAFKFYAHTRKNLDYRYEKVSTASTINQYYPVSKWNVNFVYTGGGIPNAQIFYSVPLVDNLAKVQPYQALNYHSVFGTQATFNVVSNVYSNQSVLNDVTKFPFRIHASEKQAKESQLNNWRVFLALNYHENDKTKGEITNLQGYDDQLLIHTVQSLFVTRDRGNLQSSDLGITIGTGGIFDFPPKEVIYDNLGYTGTQHQFGCAMTKLGYTFPDAQQGKYFIYNKDSGIVELSNVGLFNFFKEFGKGAHNDYSNSEASGLSAWNACFDEYNGRLLIGYRNRLVEDPASFTLSYSDAFKSFTSFHSYHPHLITNTRKGVYSFDGNRFYKHNTPNKGYYAGMSLNAHRNEIDIVFNTTKIPTQKGVSEGGKEFNKLWQSFNWQTEMHTYDNTAIYNLETFTKAVVRTKKQCSDLKSLTTFDVIRLFDNSWYFNAFRDRLDRSGFRMAEFAPFVENLNNELAITYPNNTDFNSRFVDTYVILRLIYNSESMDRELHLLSLDYTNKPVKK